MHHALGGRPKCLASIHYLHAAMSEASRPREAGIRRNLFGGVPGRMERLEAIQKL